MFDELAPDFEQGLSAAHRIKALQLFQELQRSGQAKDPKILERLKWHLEHTDNKSAIMSQAWASYYLAVGEVDRAIKYLNDSASENPKIYIAISEIHRNRGDAVKQKQSIEQAERAFRKELGDDKFNHQIRVTLANVLVRQGNIEEAKKVLITGLKLKPDRFISRASADFLAMQYDRAREANADLGEQLGFLVDALKLDPNHVKIYKRLVAMYMASKESPDRMATIRETLQGVVTSEQPSALAHLALSNVYEQEGKPDQARFHLEQAHKMDRNMPLIVNNLAWSLAHAEQPDLERALELAKTAVGQVPNNPRLRDTYGTILLKLERYREAAAELNLALQGSSKPEKIHAKLGLAYEKLGMDDLAQIHRNQSIAIPTEVQ